MTTMCFYSNLKHLGPEERLENPVFKVIAAQCMAREASHLALQYRLSLLSGSDATYLERLVEVNSGCSAYRAARARQLMGLE